MNRDLAATAAAVMDLAEAAQRALTGRVVWTPTDAAAAVRAELLPLWPEVSPAAVRDALASAAALAVASGITRAPEPVATWPADALLSAVCRSQKPDPWPGLMGPLTVASLVAFDPGGDTEALQVLAVMLALAYAPGAPFWRQGSDLSPGEDTDLP